MNIDEFFNILIEMKECEEHIEGKECNRLKNTLKIKFNSLNIEDLEKILNNLDFLSSFGYTYYISKKLFTP